MPLVLKVAFHEAGHAVVAKALGIPVHDVTIVSTDEELGYCMFSDPRFGWGRGDGTKSKAARSFAIALYAGAEAERLLLNSQDVGDGADRHRATQCLAWAGAVRGAVFVGDEHFDRVEAKLRKKAEALVDKNRALIERVANALMERRTISGEELDELLAELQHH